MTDWTRRKTSDLILALMARASGPPPDLVAEIDRRLPQSALPITLPERKLSERKKEYLRLGGGNYPNAIHEAYRANDDKAVKSLRRDREAL